MRAIRELNALMPALLTCDCDDTVVMSRDVMTHEVMIRDIMTHDVMTRDVVTS